MGSAGITTAFGNDHQHCAGGCSDIGVTRLDGVLGKGQAVRKHPLVLEVQGQCIDRLHDTCPHQTHLPCQWLSQCVLVNVKAASVVYACRLCIDWHSSSPGKADRAAAGLLAAHNRIGSNNRLDRTALVLQNNNHMHAGCMNE